MQDLSIGSDSDSDPQIEICNRDGDLSLKWVQYPFGEGIQILVEVSGNMFCLILCSHGVWSPSPSPSMNLSPAMEINNYKE